MELTPAAQGRPIVRINWTRSLDQNVLRTREALSAGNRVGGCGGGPGGLGGCLTKERSVTSTLNLRREQHAFFVTTGSSIGSGSSGILTPPTSRTRYQSIVVVIQRGPTAVKFIFRLRLQKNSPR